MIRKPQGQIEVNATSNIARGDGKQVLQVIRPESFARRQMSERKNTENSVVLWCVDSDGEEGVPPEG